MSAPHGFSWIEEPLLAGMARPSSPDDFAWLRRHGVDLVVSLSEDSPPRYWINDAGLFGLHIPIEDFSAPTSEQIEQALSAIRKVNRQQRGAVVHCGAGLGRTGTLLACYLVDQGIPAGEAIAQVRDLRPGSIETPEQEQAVAEYARQVRKPPPV